jgi:hypothetical protein
MKKNQKNGKESFVMHNFHSLKSQQKSKSDLNFFYLP